MLPRTAVYKNIPHAIPLQNTPSACGATQHAAFPSIISPERGFLPSVDPNLIRLPTPFDAHEHALQQLPGRIAAASNGSLRRWLTSLPPVDLDALADHDDASHWRAMHVLSFLAHAYMWGEPNTPPPQHLPASLAVPWHALATLLQMPPVLVYATYNLLNWRRLDPEGPIALGNLACLSNFYGGMDEEWFRLVHVEIEAHAAPAVAGIPKGQEAAQQGDASHVRACLDRIHTALVAMQATLARMQERCDPYIYYHRVRVPMSGWKNNPALPHGLLYQGVSDTPLQLYGETGAQSSVLFAFDACLGVQHKSGWLSTYLKDMEAHMPLAHRQYLEQLRARPPVRDFILAENAGDLLDAYNEVVHQLERFRAQHAAFAYTYIRQFSQQEVKGTGGTDFMPALREYRDNTAQSRV